MLAAGCSKPSSRTTEPAKSVAKRPVGRVSLGDPRGPFRTVFTSPGGSWIATWCDQTCTANRDAVVLIELPKLEGKVLRPKPDDLGGGRVFAGRFDASEKRVATTTHNQVRLWSLPDLSPIARWDVTAIYGAIGFGGNHLAASSVFGAARVVKMDDGTGLYDAALHEGAASYNGGVHWSPDGTRVALLSNGRVHIVKPGAEAEPIRIDDGWDETFSFHWSDDGAFLVHVSQECKMVLRELARPEKAHVLADGRVGDRMGSVPKPLCNVRFDGTMLTTFHPERKARRWALADPRQPAKVFDVDAAAKDTGTLDRKRHHPFRDEGGRAVALDVETGDCVRIAPEGTPWWLDDGHVAVATDEHLSMYDVNKKLRLRVPTRGVTDTAFVKKDGRVVLIVAADGDLHLTRVADGKRIHVRGVLEGIGISMVVVDDEGRFDGDPAVAAKALEVSGGSMPAATPGLAASFLDAP